MRERSRGRNLDCQEAAEREAEEGGRENSCGGARYARYISRRTFINNNSDSLAMLVHQRSRSAFPPFVGRDFPTIDSNRFSLSLPWRPRRIREHILATESWTVSRRPSLIIIVSPPSSSSSSVGAAISREKEREGGRGREQALSHSRARSTTFSLSIVARSSAESEDIY